MNVVRVAKAGAGCVAIGWSLVGYPCVSGEAGVMGRVEGYVTFQGEVPKSEIPDEAGTRGALIEVDAKSKGVKGVVIHLKSSPHAAAPGQQIADPVMDQVNYRFVPRVLAVRAGAAVVFTNSDAGNHNVRASSTVATNEFNVYTGVEGSYKRVFATDPKYRPVRVGCDIHPWMRGWIYVFDHPYFAVTDEQGQFTIPGVPPGEHQLEMVQPDIGYREQRTVVVKPGETGKIQAAISANERKRP